MTIVPQRAVRYIYLNREPAWSGFQLTGLERLSDGTLSLVRAPRPIGTIGMSPTNGTATPPAGAGTGPAPGPAGVAIDCGDLYASDPASNRVSRFNPCLAQPEPWPCIGGPGPWPGQLDTPRGLAVLPAAARPRLAVAEEGNDRVQVFDLATGQSLLLLGKTGPDGRPQPGNGVGEFNAPWGLAADVADNLYVADHGNARVQKLGPRGAPDAAFAATIAQQVTPPKGPVAVSIAGPSGQQLLYVLDVAAGSARVLVFNTQGQSQPPGAFTIDPTDVAAPTALAIVGGSIYVGSLDGSMVRYDDAGRLVSRYVGPDGSPPVRALAVDSSGMLLACPGGWPLTRFNPTGGHGKSGRFRAGPIAVSVPPMAWHRWRVEAEPLDAAAGVQLFTMVALPGPSPPPEGPDDDPFPASSGWAALPRNQLDVAILDDDAIAVLKGKPTPSGPDVSPDDPPRDVWIWLAGRLEGDGLVSPVFRQMRIDVAPGSSLRYLPRIYREGSILAPQPTAAPAALAQYRLASLQSRLLLDLWLAAIDAELGRTAAALAELPRRFDPAAAPAAGLPWLASWLEFDWLETWPEADARRYLAGAFALGRIRGTTEGLRRYLKIYAGVDAWVEEPSALNGGAPWCWARPPRSASTRSSPRRRPMAPSWRAPRRWTIRTCSTRPTAACRSSATSRTSSASRSTPRRWPPPAHWTPSTPCWPVRRPRTPRITSACSPPGCAWGSRRASDWTRSSPARPPTSTWPRPRPRRWQPTAHPHRSVRWASTRFWPTSRGVRAGSARALMSAARSADIRRWRDDGT